MRDYSEDYNRMFEESKLLSEHCPKVASDMRHVVKDALEPKSLDTKTKELIALGIAISVRCEYCIMGHVKASVKAGATMEDIAETVGVAVLMGGGPSTAFGGKALAIAEFVFSEEKK